MNCININDIVVYPEQRETRPDHVQYIAKKIKERGYNTSYPITLDSNNGLVDGGHRLEAAKITGLVELPYVLKPDGISNIAYAIYCNEDGATTRVYDVFDYARHCYMRAVIEGWELKDIAGELGWGEIATVTRYKNIKSNLHPACWQLTRNQYIVNTESDGFVNRGLTIVNWIESHFRAIFSDLAYNPDKPDKTIYRAQLKTIRAALANPKKVTAKWLGKQAEQYAWWAELSRYMRDNIAKRAPLKDRKQLLKSINSGVFGDKKTDDNLAKFERAVSAINEEILGVTLFQDDAFQKIPTLDDKSISLIVTDPPYNVTDNEWDDIGTDSEYIEFIRTFLDILKPKLADDYHFFMCISPQYQARIETLLVEQGWPLKSRIVWSHRNMSKGRDVADKFIGTWEMIFHCGTHNLNWSPEWDQERFEVQEWAAPQSNFDDKKVHPTQKPIGLFELFIKIGSKPGDIVLDPFAGGGTTGAACKSTAQRQCILIEAEDQYCEVIENRLGVKRWQA